MATAGGSVTTLHRARSAPAIAASDAQRGCGDVEIGAVDEHQKREAEKIAE